jgi:phosphatidylglycerophosphate synthase
MSHDTWIHRGVRVSVRPLARMPVTPNHLTALCLAAGFAAAAAFAAGTPGLAAVGAAAFIVSMLLDRADGELARITGQHSAFGHVFDLIADTLCNALVFVGIGVGLKDGALGGFAVVLGLIAGGAVAAVLVLVMRAEARAGARAGELKGFAGFDPDDAMLAVPVAVLLGWGEPMLIAAAIGAPAVAGFFAWRERRWARGG